MTKFMQTALNLLTEPAALYEYPSMRFVGWNDAGRARGEAKRGQDGGDPTMSWLDRTDAEIVQAVNAAPDRHYVIERPTHCLHFSVLEPLPTHPRPELLLVTAHVGRTSEGYLQHTRMRTALFVNEAVELADLQLDASVQAMAATRLALRAAAQIYNDAAGTAMSDMVVENLQTGG